MAQNDNTGGATQAGFTPFTSILSRHEGERVYASVDPGKLKRDAEEQARITAAEIVSKGKAEAGETRQKAYDEGFAKGRQEGLVEVRREHEAMLARLRELMQEIEVKCADAVSLFAEQEVLDLVKVMVERLVSHEVSVNPKVIRATLLKALSYVVENSEVRVLLNPDDFNRLKEAGLEETVLLDGLNRIQLVEDHAMEAGGCLLHTDFGEIDATLANRRQKLYQAVDRAFMAMLAKDVSSEHDDEEEIG